MDIKIPQKVSMIIDKLMENGYEAYAVGGCVRDMCLGKEPDDWDITTSASPVEIKSLFRRTVDTGIEHGTVTVLLDKDQFEVTTYRIDGSYEDHRRPKNVSFTSSLREDLKRRDFTINAMAYNKEEGIVDEFAGIDDLKDKLIRCVGSPNERFEEDALRILRAFRFSAQLGFDIEESTLKAAIEKADLLKNISAERIRMELNKLLISNHPEVLRDLYKAGITSIILPEFDLMMETDQKNIHHIYTVGEHTIRTVSEVAGKQEEKRFTDHERSVLRWTMLLHDIEKPGTITLGEDGQNHFYGHQVKGAKTANKILKRLKFDNDTIDKVVHLVRWHDYRFSLNAKAMRRAVSKIGRDYMELFFEVSRADTSGKNPAMNQEKHKSLSEARRLYKEFLDQDACVSLDELKISGKDLIDEGYKPGKDMGKLLDKLLKEVIDNPQLNKKEILLDLAREFSN